MHRLQLRPQGKQSCRTAPLRKSWSTRAFRAAGGPPAGQVSTPIVSFGEEEPASRCLEALGSCSLAQLAKQCSIANPSEPLHCPVEPFACDMQCRSMIYAQGHGSTDLQRHATALSENPIPPHHEVPRCDSWYTSGRLQPTVFATLIALGRGILIILRNFNPNRNPLAQVLVIATPRQVGDARTTTERLLHLLELLPNGPGMNA